jgi:heme/copper-type cytochrome/quinol oxidase subunit 2
LHCFRYPVLLLKIRAMCEIIQTKVAWIIMSIVLAAARPAFACAACSGRSDDAVAHGLNAAVFTMLVVLLAVLGALVSFLAYLARRAAKHPVAVPGAPGGVVR